METSPQSSSVLPADIGPPSQQLRPDDHLQLLPASPLLLQSVAELADLVSQLLHAVQQPLLVLRSRRGAGAGSQGRGGDGARRWLLLRDRMRRLQ